LMSGQIQRVQVLMRQLIIEDPATNQTEYLCPDTGAFF